MGNIANFIDKIKHAIYGKDVRQSICDAIEQTYEDAIAHGHTDMEVVQARKNYDNLNARLNMENSNVNSAIETEKTNRTNADNNLQNQINSLASGSPKGVYATTSALVSANPETGVYVVTADGHIYSWTKNGSSAVDLGVYQSTGIEKNSVTEEMTTFLKTSLLGNLVTNEFLEYNHHYITSNGTIARSDAVNYVYKYPREFLGETVPLSLYKVSALWAYAADDTALGKINGNSIRESLSNYPNYSYIRAGVFGNNINDAFFGASDFYREAFAYEIENLKVNTNQLVGPINNNKIEDETIKPYKTNYLKLSKQGNLITDRFIYKDGYFLNNSGQFVEADNHTTIIYKFTREFLDIETDNDYTIRLPAGGGVWAYAQDGTALASSSYIGSLKSLFENNPTFDYILFWTYKSGIASSVFALTKYYTSQLKNKYAFDELSITSDQVYDGSLNGKKIVFFGDSWTAPNSEKDLTFSDYVRLHNTGIEAYNRGRNGADWSQGYNYWFVSHPDQIADEYDYIIIEAYTNGLYGDVSSLAKPLGTINEFTYYDSQEEIDSAYSNSYARDLEKMIFACVNKWKGKKIGLMFPYKSVDMMRENNAFRQFRPQVFACCRKYNIPVFDNFDSSNVPTFTQEDIDNYFFHGDSHGEHGDGVHLNSAGSALVNPRINNWIKTL